MSTIYTIYSAKNKDKVYIGFTSFDLEKRKKEHMHHAMYCVSQYFHKALKKHGTEVFVWEVVYQSKDKDHCLEMEEYFIQQYDSRKTGYNLATGGKAINLGRKFPNKRKSTNPRKPVSLETREKQRIAKLGNSIRLGKTHSIEAKEKISKALKGNKNNPRSRGVICIHS